GSRMVDSDLTALPHRQTRLTRRDPAAAGESASERLARLAAARVELERDRRAQAARLDDRVAVVLYEHHVVRGDVRRDDDEMRRGAPYVLVLVDREHERGRALGVAAFAGELDQHPRQLELGNALVQLPEERLVARVAHEPRVRE